MTPEEILQVEKDIVATLKNIYDPEIPVNIYDLGLIYEIDYEPDGQPPAAAPPPRTARWPTCSSRTSISRWPRSTA